MSAINDIAFPSQNKDAGVCATRKALLAAWRNAIRLLRDDEALHRQAKDSCAASDYEVLCRVSKTLFTRAVEAHAQLLRHLSAHGCGGIPASL